MISVTLYVFSSFFLVLIFELYFGEFLNAKLFQFFQKCNALFNINDVQDFSVLDFTPKLFSRLVNPSLMNDS